MVLEELVTFMGKAGNRQATLFFEKEYIQPYKVEFHSENEFLGSLYFAKKEEAERAARSFAFIGDNDGNSNV